MEEKIKDILIKSHDKFGFLDKEKATKKLIVLIQQTNIDFLDSFRENVSSEQYDYDKGFEYTDNYFE